MMPTTPHGRRWTTSRQPMSHVGRSREPIVRGASIRCGFLFQELERRGGRKQFAADHFDRRPADLGINHGDEVIGALDEQCAQAADGSEPIANREPRPRLLRRASRGDFGGEGRHGDSLQRAGSVSDRRIPSGR